ncbi:hypothetical protein RHSIM_Rhsim13G0005400 [Rhododendron simsii]|uniref:Multidrug resistance protein ABC transporter family protein n=1 Tax=Rhododendron simsii TaxID=118357 RepID=A0A834G779_RHOSS|nr:hypothetical protein RHSIM_Rhsim13G0005400 [Rhododendron simsii]
MGNRMSDRSSVTPGKVILSDGSVHEYEKPLTAAELMLEHPQQVVVEFRSAVADRKKPNPLPADEKLEMGKVYLMLPKRRGKPPALTSEEARHLLLTANSVLGTKRPILSTATGFVPMLARLCTAGKRDGEGFVVKIGKEKVMGRREEVKKVEFFAPEALEELQPEFLNRQISGGKGWKPSLDTIKEKAAKKTVPHWLF